MSPIKKFIFFKAFPVPFLVFGAKYLFFGILFLLNAHASLGWPSVQGKVIESSVSYNRSTNRGMYVNVFAYDYIVDEKMFTGNRISYGRRLSNLNSHAHDLSKRYPKDEIVSVSYKPSNPRESVLEPGITVWTWVKPIGGIALISVGIFMYVGFSVLLKKDRSHQ